MWCPRNEHITVLHRQSCSNLLQTSHLRGRFTDDMHSQHMACCSVIPLVRLHRRPVHRASPCTLPPTLHRPLRGISVSAVWGKVQQYCNQGGGVGVTKAAAPSGLGWGGCQNIQSCHWHHNRQHYLMHHCYTSGVRYPATHLRFTLFVFMQI